MSRPYDLTVKFLLDTYPRDVLGHLLGLFPAGPITHLESELRADARMADALLEVPLSDDPAALIHLEVQTRYAPDMPLRMLDYAVRIHLKHRRPVRSWLVVLLPPSSGQEPLREAVGWGDPAGGTGLLFRYGVVRVWELEPELGWNHPGLLPLVPLMGQEEPAAILLERCTTRVEGWDLPPAERGNLLWCIGNLASLRYDQSVIREWWRRLDMIETPLMQQLRAEGEAKGKAEGEAKGKAEGKAEGEARALLTILTTRGLSLSEAQREKILTCTDLAQLEEWIKRALTTSSVEDLLR